MIFSLKRPLYNVPSCYCSLNNVDEFDSKYFPHDMPCVSFCGLSSQIETPIDNSIDVNDKEFSHEMINLFGSYCYVSSLNLCGIFLCKYMSIRRMIEGYVCLDLHIPILSLFSMYDSRLKECHLFHSKISDQNHVFNPEYYCFISLKEIERRIFMLPKFMKYAQLFHVSLLI